VSLILQMMSTRHDLPPSSILIMLVFLALYVFVTVSGLLVVHNPQKTGPLLVAVAMQVPMFSSPLIAYKFASGFQITLAIVDGRFKGAFLVGSDFQFNLFQRLRLGIGVNAFALLMLILLTRSMMVSHPTIASPGEGQQPLRLVNSKS